MKRNIGVACACVVLTLVSGCSGSDSGTSTEPVIETANDTAAETMLEASILRLDPRLDALVPTDAEVEKLAEGFVFIEGPVWLRGESRLLFSDVRGNTIYQCTGCQRAGYHSQSQTCRHNSYSYTPFFLRKRRSYYGGRSREGHGAARLRWRRVADSP